MTTHYIVYGASKIELNIFKQVSEKFTPDNTITVEDDLKVEEVRSMVRYKPFFLEGWLVVANLSKLSQESVMKCIALIKNPLVTFYGRIPHSKKFNKPNKDLFDAIKRSKVINSLEGLTVVNTLYPNKAYIKGLIFSELKGIYLSDNALHYLIENIRFNLEILETTLDELKDSGLTNISLPDMKKVLPRAQSRSLKHYVYAVLLSHRPDLKELWNDADKKILSQNGGTKKKPYMILEEVSLPAEYSLDIIIGVLSDMIRLKSVYQRGYYTTKTIFDQKEKLENSFTIMKKLYIPDIIDFSHVFSEVSKADLLYVLTNYMKLKSFKEVTYDDLYLVTRNMMNRF